MKQKQYCNKFTKALKMVHIKKKNKTICKARLWIRRGLVGMHVTQILSLHWKQKQDVGGLYRGQMLLGH